ATHGAPVADRNAAAREYSPLRGNGRQHADLYTLPQGLAREIIPGIRCHQTMADTAIVLIEELPCILVTLLRTDGSTQQAGNNQAEPYEVTPHLTLLARDAGGGVRHAHCRSPGKRQCHSAHQAYVAFSLICRLSLAGEGLTVPAHGIRRKADLPRAHAHPVSPHGGTA